MMLSFEDGLDKASVKVGSLVDSLGSERDAGGAIGTMCLANDKFQWQGLERNLCRPQHARLSGGEGVKGVL